MTALVVGLSHRSAAVSLLEETALTPSEAADLAQQVLASPYVAESLVVATCNRVEVYADVSKFHGGVLDVTEALVKAGRSTRERLTPHLYVSYDDRAVQHLFEVSSGLDSMVVGEAQILGQVRSALRAAQDHGTVGRTLNDLAQTALRVGKRVHSDTGIDRAGASVVSVGLEGATQALGDLAGRRAVVVGAGAMSRLALAHLQRAGVTDVVVANRTPERATSAAAAVGARTAGLDELPVLLAEADLVVSCTGASRRVLPVALVAAARAGSVRPLVVVDLGLPHDTDPEIGALPGVTRLDLADITSLPGATASARDVALAREIVAAELSAYLAAQAASGSSPSSCRCGRRPTRWSRPRCSDCACGCPPWATPPRPRSGSPCAARSVRCCTPRRCG